jgi:GNAT superfamily N-acetyltransferase
VNLELTDDVDRISWTELAHTIEMTPLGSRDPKKLETAFRNSLYRCFAFSDGALIGAARAISDGVTYAVVFDVVVLPGWQRQGVGTQIMQYLLDRARADVHSVILYAIPGREGFYEKLGFRLMTTAMALFGNPERRRELGYII